MRVVKHSADSDVKGQNDRYILQHNLSMESLLFAKEMGALVCPSLAIARADNPMTDFGEITLIAPGILARPESGALVFSGDAYVKKAPVAWAKIDKSKVRDCLKKSDEFLMEMELEDWISAVDPLVHKTDRIPHARDRLKNILQSNIGLSMQFLWHEGLDPRIESTPNPLRKMIISHVVALNSGKQFESMDEGVVRKAIDDQDLLDRISRFIDRNVNPPPAPPVLDAATIRNAASESIKTEVLKGSGYPKYDKDATAREISRTLSNSKGLRKRFELLIHELVLAISPDQYIKNPRGFTRLTAESLAKHLKSSYVGSEEFDSVSQGRLKAASITLLKTTSQVAAAMRILGDEATIAEESQRIDGLSKKLTTYMFSRGLGKKNREHVYTPLGILFPFLAKKEGGIPTDGEIMHAFAAYGVSFEGDRKEVTRDAIKTFKRLVEDVRDSHVPYFEAKMQRAVDLGEFAVAVVPSSLPTEVITFLKSKISEIRIYETDDNSMRREAISRGLPLANKTVAVVSTGSPKI